MPTTRDPDGPEGRARRRALLAAFGAEVGRVLPPPAEALGESLIRRAQTEAAAEPEPDEERHLIRFGAEWRAFVRRQAPDRLAVLDEMIDERIERRALLRYYRRVRNAAVALAVAGFAVAQFGLDRLPVVRQVWRLLKGELR